MRRQVAAGEAITGQRTLTRRFGRENDAFNISSQSVQPTDFSTHAVIYNTFNVQRHLICRKTLRQFRSEAMRTWRAVTAAA